MCNLLSHRTNRTFFDALNNFDLVYFLLFLPAFTHLFTALWQNKSTLYGCFLFWHGEILELCVAARYARGGADNQAKPSRQARLSARRAPIAPRALRLWRNGGASRPKAAGFCRSRGYSATSQPPSAVRTSCVVVATPQRS